MEATATAPPETEHDMQQPGPMRDVVSGKAVGFSAGNQGRYVSPRNVSREVVRVTTGPRCARHMQVFDYLFDPCTVVDVEVYRDQRPLLESMVETEEDAARWAEAERDFDRAFYEQDVRAALSRFMTDEMEHDRLSKGPLRELKEACESAAQDSPLAKALAHARASTPLSPQRSFHKLFAAEHFQVRPFLKVETISRLGPPLKPVMELAASVAAGASKGSDLTPLVTQILQRLDQQAAENAKLIALLVAQGRPAAKDGGK